MRFLPRQLRFPGLSLLVVILLLIFLHYSAVLRPLERLLVGLISPIQSRVYSVGRVINQFYRQADNDLSGTNPAQLLAQRDALLVENSQLKISLAEYQAEKEQRHFLAERGFEAITARVIGKNFQSDSQILIVNQGSQAGIAVGLPVIVGEGLVVAKVLAVDKNTSQILLLNDSQSILAAMIQDSEAVPGVVVGERGLSLKMELIPSDKIVQTDELAVTSGLEVDIPAGLVIGLVDRIEKDANSFFQTAFIKSPIDYENLLIVSILTHQAND